jgi:hypothetical protein
MLLGFFPKKSLCTNTGTVDLSEKNTVLNFHELQLQNSQSIQLLFEWEVTQTTRTCEGNH